MKKIKILAVGLVLSLTGAVYALSTQSTSESCPLAKDGTNCCKPGADCCKGGDGDCCKAKRMMAGK